MASISVIIPNYNHARFLPERIESVFAQTRADIDVLILDDCSPDDSRSVIERYRGDPRVKLLFNQTNSGNTFAQWRKGLEHTRGDYVWIAESDDASAPEFLEKMAAALDANPGVGMAACESLVVDSEGQPQHRFLEQMARGGHIDYAIDIFAAPFVMAGRDYCARYMVPWNTLPNASAVLFRRSALLAAGGPDESMRLCGDWMTYCKVLLLSDFAWVPTAMNYFRTHRQSVRSRTRAIDFVAQALAVQHHVAEALGRRPARSTLDHVRDQYCNALISRARPDGGGKVAIGRIPGVIGDAAQFGWPILTRSAQILARETMIGAAQRTGLLRGGRP